MRGGLTAMLSVAIAALLVSGLASGQSFRRVHDSGICIDPDVEFPVPCEDDDD